MMNDPVERLTASNALKLCLFTCKAVLGKKQRVIVEGAHMIKKHMRKSQQYPQGTILNREGSIHLSNSCCPALWRSGGLAVRILLCGDVVGKAGRACVIENLPRLRRSLALDFIIVNGENAAAGFGITDKICAEFYAAGVDAITTGNHVWDRREIIPYIADDPKLLRPANLPR